MSAKILEGKSLALQIQEEVKLTIKDLKFKPCLAVILVGDDPASHIYVNRKHNMCNEVGIKTIMLNMPTTVSKSELLDYIKDWNEDPDIHGILVQLPLPTHIDKYEVLNAVDPNKDVDGFHALNIGNIVHGRAKLLPCTPLGICRLLDKYEIDVDGKNVTIVNDSIVVGRPLAMILLNKGATVTICHVRTKTIDKHIKEADVLVTAVGRRPKFVVGVDKISPNQVIIDVGVNRINGKIHGDVDFEPVSKIVRAITPPVGGVGPLTVAMLLNNTVAAAQFKV